MKCKKCGNEYPSNYYFATQDICNECYSKMTEEEKDQLSAQPQQGYDYPPVYYRVGFGLRFGAAVIDFIIWTIISFIVMYLTGFFESAMELGRTISANLGNTALLTELTEEFAMDNMQTFLLLYALNLVYFFLEVLNGATPGKMILNIRIANADRTAGTYKNLLNRYLLKHSNTILNLLATVTFISILDLLSFIALIVIFIGCFFVLGDQRQALHDMLAKTAVYYNDQVIENDEQKINQ